MKKREVNYDCLRAISCIAIIMLHVSASYWGAVDTGKAEFLVMAVYNGLTRFAVPVFMMLSGAFVLESSGEEVISKCIRRFGKLLLNFYLWSAFFAFQGIAIKLMMGKEVTAELWEASLQRFMWGHYHMWFVFLILGFYVLVPILKPIMENKVIVGYFVILWIAFRFIIPTISEWTNWYLLNNWISHLNLNLFVGYLGYFVLGYYIRKYGISKKIEWVIYALGISGVVYSLVQTVLQSRELEEVVEANYSPGTWNVLFFSLAVFTFFGQRKEMRWGEKYFIRLADSSFIIYMIHPFFLEKLNMLGITVLSFHCVISIPVLTIGIFIMSYVSARIIKRIPYVNTWIL